MTAPSNNFDFQNFYSATLTGDITSGTLTIPLDIAPTPTEGVLVIDPDSTSPEVIFYTSKGASSVTCPADGRGWDSSSAAAHGQGTTVIMAPTAYAWRMLKTGSLYDSYATGWTTLGYGPNTVTANGNRSYDLVFSAVDLTSTVTTGMRLKLPRTATAPTQCTDLESSSSQYYSKTSPAGMTFTDDFTVSAWIKLESYPARATIASRANGTQGWLMDINSDGTVRLIGYNASLANFSLVQSYQSIPLNKWVHVAAQLDMSTFTATTTTSYIMIDGQDVPATVSRSGTNPTALVQAGNLEIGSDNGGSHFFDGKIAQVAIYSAKVTQATIKASMNQTLTGSETSLVSAYTFNGVITDLSANANNLTANGSAVATNTDTPFTTSVTGTNVVAGSTNYAIVMASSFSTNTTLTVQVPEGSTLPTSGGIGTCFYSQSKTPYGFPSDSGKWVILTNCYKGYISGSTPTNYQYSNFSLSVPVGAWVLGFNGTYSASRGGAGTLGGGLTLSTTTSTETDQDLSAMTYISSGTDVIGNQSKSKSVTLAAATPYYLLLRPENDAAYSGVAINAASAAGRGVTVITAANAYL